MLPKRRRRKVFQLGFGEGFVKQEIGGGLVHCGGFDSVSIRVLSRVLRSRRRVREGLVHCGGFGVV